jgi:hypothetical protein
MSRQYYAIFDPEATEATPRNVFRVDRHDDVLEMLILDRAQQRWVDHPGLIDYIAGDKADRCLPVDTATARRWARHLGADLPDDDPA